MPQAQKTTSTKRSNQFARGVAFLSGGTLLSFFLSIFTAPVTSRLFPPEAFGVAAFFISFATIVGPVAGLRYDKAILLPKEDEEASGLFYLTVFWMVLSSLVLWFPVRAFGASYLARFSAGELSGALWWFPVGVFFFAIILPMQAWLTRLTKYKRLAGARLVRQVSVSSFTIGGGLLRGPSGLYLTGLRLASQAIAPLYLLTQVATSPPKLNARTPKMMFAMLKRHWKFPAFSIGDSLLESISREGPVLLLALFYKASVVGNYSRAALLVGIPFSVLGLALEQVFYQQASSMRVAGESVGEFTKNVFLFVLRYSLLPFLALGVIGPDFFQLFLGSVWREAGVYAALISPFLLMKLLVIPIATLYNVYERQGVGIVFTGSLFIVQISALTLAGMYGTPRLSLATYAIGGSLVMLVMALWVFRLVRVRLFSVGKKSVVILFQSLLMTIPALLAQRVFDLNRIWAIIIMVGMIGLYYLITLRRDEPSKALIRSLLNRS